MEDFDFVMTGGEDTTPEAQGTSGTDNGTEGIAESTANGETTGSTEGTTGQNGEAESGADGNAGANTDTEKTADGSTTDGAAKEETPLPGLTVQFRHEAKELTHDEAVTFAQKGMKYDSVMPLIDKLNRLASMSGAKADELLEGYLNAAEENYKESLIDRYGEDSEVIDILMEKYRADNKRKYDEAEEAVKTAEAEADERAKQTLEERLAAEFGELRKEFPEIGKFEDLPKSVRAEAVKGKDLTSAYLMHLHREDVKAKQAASAAKTAKESSAGSLASAEGSNDVIDAFLNGMQGR